MKNFLIFTLLLPSFCILPSSFAAGQRPNILVILADDLGYGDTGEANNLAAKHPQVVAELCRSWDQWNAKNITPLWQGSPTEDPTATNH